MAPEKDAPSTRAAGGAGRAHGQSGLDGVEVVFVGRLAAVTQAQATGLVAAAGGTSAPAPGPNTRYVVVGQDGWPLRRDGHVPKSLAAARELARGGQALEVIGELQFLAMAGLAGGSDPELARLYPVTQLARLLDVPAARIRKWVRHGLAEPAVQRNGIDYFDFRRMTELRMLSDLTRRGVSLQRLGRSLHELATWLPNLDSPITRLILAADGGRRLAVKLAGGAIADPTGQLHLPNDARTTTTERQPADLPEAHFGAEAWFERGVLLEESGALPAAARAYASALTTGGPHAVTAYNLANVLREMGDLEAAIDRYRDAVAWDPGMVEGWNNLSSALGQAGRWSEAIRSAQSALGLAPDYADAHYNLAVALAATGNLAQARSHGRRYLATDGLSRWAALLKETLGL